MNSINEQQAERNHEDITGTRAVERIKETVSKAQTCFFCTDDPRITVIRVAPRDRYYWDNKHGNMVAGVKMMVGAMTGRTMDDSIEGRVAL